MTSSFDLQALIDKVLELSPEQQSEVEEYVDALRQKQEQRRQEVETRLCAAVEVGHIRGPKRRRSTTDFEPIELPGTPLSEMVVRARR